MNLFKKLTLPIAVVAITAGAPHALSSTLTVIPIDPVWQTNTAGVVDSDNEGRAITPDGKYVVGQSSYTTNSSQTRGFLYNIANNTSIRVLSGDGAACITATGVGYRTSGGNAELIIRGLSPGDTNWVTEWMTPDGGASFGGKRRDIGFGRNVLPAANSLGAQLGTDVYYVASSRDQTGEPVHLDQLSGPWVATIAYANKGIPGGAKAHMNGVSASGRAVGYRVETDLTRNSYMLTWNGPGSGASVAAYVNGLVNSGTTADRRGEAHSVCAYGTNVFGRSPVPGGDPAELYGYKATFSDATTTATQTSTNALPLYGDTGGSLSRAVPYGCSADGRYAVGMNYRSQEKAVIWDTGDSNPTNWTVLDLTDLAAAEGILGGFTRLTRAYSVGVNAAGRPVVTGIGNYFDGTNTWLRGFVMVVAPQPRITSVVGAGTTNVVVTWTNAFAGSNYVLQYNTNLNATNWTSLSPVTASGPEASQTNNPPAGDPQRYYRVLVQ